MPRLFVAAWPPPAVVERLAAALPRPLPAGLRWSPPSSWHVTLRFLGPCDRDEAVAALEDVDATTCEAVIGPRLVALGRSVLCLPVEGVDAVAAAVVAATGHVGTPPEPRPFTGHLTLARTRGGPRPKVPELHVTDRFPVTEVALVESRTLPSGAEYRTLHTVALGPIGRPRPGH